MLKILLENKTIFENVFYEFLFKGQQNGEIPTNINLKTISRLFYTFYSGLKVVAKVQSEPTELLNSVDEIMQLLD